jgi:hypothetical protein
MDIQSTLTQAIEVILKGNRERATGNREIPIIKIRGFVQGRIETLWLTPSRFKYFYLFS